MLAQNTECHIIDTIRKPVLDAVFDAIRKEQFYILPDPEWTEVIQLRTDKLIRLENPQNPAATITKLVSRPRVKDETSYRRWRILASGF